MESNPIIEKQDILSVKEVVADIVRHQSEPGKGRKYFDGKNPSEVIQKLIDVWAIGGSDGEASFYADISKAALSDLLKHYPALSERKVELKNKPVLKARKVVVDGLTDFDNGLKYLERVRSDEFSVKTKTEHTGKDGTDLFSTLHNLSEEELQSRIEKIHARITNASSDGTPPATDNSQAQGA